MKKYAMIPALALLLALTAGVVNAAMIKTMPATTNWIADGVTEYKLYIYVDNTGLNDEPTDGVQWKLVDTQGMQYVAGSSGAPGIEDFFVGVPAMYEIFNDPLETSGRMTDEIGAGPVDYQGYVGMYKFKVPTGTTPGTYQFELNPVHTTLWSPYGERQTASLESFSFQIVQPSSPPIAQNGKFFSQIIRRAFAVLA
jgi:hypothetical protein